MLIVIAILVGLLSSIILILKLKNARTTNLVNKIPGPPTNFIFGNVFPFLLAKRDELFELNLKLMKPYMKYPIHRVWVGRNAQINIVKASALEAVLSSNKLIDKAYTYTFLQPWLGLGLLTSTGDKWRSRRKLLTPTFHFRILEDFISIFNEQAEVLTNILKQFDGKDYFDIYPYLTHCTLDIIAETAMGVKTIKAQLNEDSEYVQAVNEISDIINQRVIVPWLYSNWFFNLTPTSRTQKKCLKILHEFTNKVIRDRQEEFLEKKKVAVTGAPVEEVMGQKRRLAFLDLLLESSYEGAKLDFNDLRDEVNTFMFEGHDTTGVAANFILYSIGHYPGIQDKVHQELDNIFGNSTRPVTSDDLKEMKYLELVIKESLRLFPPVPFFGRVPLEDVKIGEYILPAGVDLNFPTYMIHRDPEYFPDPEKFIPERFLPENSIGRNPYAYIPFSAGPRNCIGQKFAMMEEKILISHILRRFCITAMYEVSDLKYFAELVLRPSGGMWLKLESR